MAILDLDGGELLDLALDTARSLELGLTPVESHPSDEWAWAAAHAARRHVHLRLPGPLPSHLLQTSSGEGRRPGGRQPLLSSCEGSLQGSEQSVC